MFKHKILLLFLTLLPVETFSKEIEVNSVSVVNAPEWLTSRRVEKVIDKIQNFLEWDIRKIKVYFYSDEKAFQSFHHMGNSVAAVSRKSDSTMHVGPKVLSTNFDVIFGHELVHLILGQKYKDAIPAWLEEGLANYLVKAGPVDYKRVFSATKDFDVHLLEHPYKKSPLDADVHYMASRAAVEMIAKKCDLLNLLQMSVDKGLETYLPTLCEMPDVNAAFHTWVKKKAR